MSRGNLDLLRSAYAKVNEGGFTAIADMIDPEFTMDSPQGLEASQAHDKEGLREWFGKMDEIWEELRFEPEEIAELDATTAIAVVHTVGRAGGTGIEIDTRLTHLWTVRDGRLASLTTFNNKDEAVEAADLSD